MAFVDPAYKIVANLRKAFVQQRIVLMVCIMLALAGLYAAPATRAQGPATPRTPEHQREVIENLPWPETVTIVFTAATWIWQSNSIPNDEVAAHYDPPPPGGQH